MVTDSLRYWVQEMHVDGFRFDLGTILARETYGFDQQSGFLRAVGQDPNLGAVKLITEPWDCGPGGYQVGGFPPGWAEWNDRYRDTVRSFWKGDAGKLSDFASRLTGSADFFAHRGRGPWSSVNFVTAHDGFTLNDVCAYDAKHNEANGEDNRDGSDNNHSWNCGAEGPTDDPEINALRERQIRNMLASLLLSRGTPMLLAGDEFGRTQNGNNNAYCQDNEISWLNWDIKDKGQELIRFVALLSRIRQRFPILHRNRWLTAAWNDDLGIKDVTWLTPTASEMTSENWTDPNGKCIGILLDGRAQTSGISRRGEDATLLLIVNSYWDMVPFKLPKVAGGHAWRCVVDTDKPDQIEAASFTLEDTYEVTGRSMLVFELDKEASYQSAREEDEGRRENVLTKTIASGS
jgi:isoamylase